MHRITFCLLLSLVLVFIIFTIHLIWRRRHWYRAAKQFAGPPTLPIIGNGYLFMCRNEDILMRIHNVVKEYTPGPIRFWLGPILLIALPNPVHVEKILSSPKFSRKHDVYRFPQVFLGNGLITGSGPMLKIHRRIIQPMFDLNFLRESTAFVQNHVALCMERLESFVNKGNFDFFHEIQPCMADIIKEIILGSSERSQLSGITEFDEALSAAYEIAFARMMKVWQQSDILYSMNPMKRKQDRVRKIIRTKGKLMTEDAFNRRKLLQPTHDFYPIIDRMADYIVENPGVIDEETFIDHILTLYAASEDTLSIISSFLAMCLGMDPKCQEKAVQEIKDVFGETARPVTTDDLPKLRYIDMCVKETIRLFPIAPIIARKCTSYFEMENWMIPKGCAIAIPIFSIHRDPRSWEKPDEFYPEHFLPEAESKRHVYSYIPFSAGPRGCIGKILANTGLKVFICNFLQRYEVVCDGTVPNLKLKMDISTRPREGCYLRIKERICK